MDFEFHPVLHILSKHAKKSIKNSYITIDNCLEYLLIDYPEYECSDFIKKIYPTVFLLECETNEIKNNEIKNKNEIK